MTAREMHYDFKQKLNRIDSQKFSGLLVPEIDWKLNEAQEVFVKSIAQPRNSPSGFEFNQRTIDDIRPIVVNQEYPQTFCQVYKFGSSSFIAYIPQDYWYYASSYAFATKGECKKQKLYTHPRQHDDESELSAFDKSSFEWREVNIRFVNDGIRIFTDGSFEINGLELNYLTEPPRIHNAQDFVGGTYTTLDGVVLTGAQNCILPKNTHRDIVDLAVLITAGDLSLPDYTLKGNKLKITETI